MSRRRRTLRARLLLAAGSTGLVLGVAEAALRATRPDPPRVLPQRELLIGRPDPLLGWSNRAGLDRFEVKEITPAGRVVLGYEVSTNTAGLRGRREYAVPRPADVRRVACAGDSFTFGHGVDTATTFPALLEQRPGVEAPNLGVMGYGLAQSVLRLARDGLPLRPQAVLLSVIDDDVRRDLEDWAVNGQPRPRFRLLDGRLVAPALPLRAPLAPGSLLPRETSGLALLDGLKAAASAARARATGLPPWLGGGAWELWRALLLEARATCARADAELVVVYVPSAAGGSPLASLLAALGRDVGFRTVDLTPHLEGPDRAELYIPGDGHPSVAGHARIARALASELPDLLGP